MQSQKPPPPLFPVCAASLPLVATRWHSALSVLSSTRRWEPSWEKSRRTWTSSSARWRTCRGSWRRFPSPTPTPCRGRWSCSETSGWRWTLALFLAFSFIFILRTVNFNPIFWRLALSYSFPIQTERVNWEGKNIKTLSRTLLLATVETRWHTMAISFINLWTKTPPPF